MAIKRGQITKKDIPGLLKQLDDFESGQSERIAALKPEFRQWLADQVTELRQRINEQDFWFSVDSQAKHLTRSFLRMESGEIESLTDTGGFNIKR